MPPGDILSNIELPETSEAPFGLTVPYQLYKPAIDTLEQLGIPFASPRKPSAPDRAAVLLLDDTDYIIAQEFEVQVPDFVHLDEWFNP